MTLSTTVRAPKPTQTARHTKILHRMPLKNSVIQSGVTFDTATEIMAPPTAPPFMSPICAKYTRATATSAPARLPSHTSAQFFAMAPSVIFLLANAHTISMLPVNSSAPQQSTSTRPRLKHRPPTTR